MKFCIFLELWSAEERVPQHQTDMVFRCPEGQVTAHQAYLKEFCKIFSQLCFGVKSMVRASLRYCQMQVIA